jgi:NAD(P)-dependent dehydrogenase (short-subunit alcohol dehydrogenase family)
MTDPFSLDGDIALVTGGGTGIGLGIGRCLAARGARVVLAGRRADVLDEAVAEIGRAAQALPLDVTDREALPAAVARIEDEIGPVAALVNNAGILERQARVEQMDAARIARVLATNVIGPFLCAREAVTRMSTARGGAGGAIVNVSSRAAVLGAPGEYVDYAVSKGAIDTFTVGLAREVAGEGIRVNAVRPGIIHSDIHASGGDPGRVDRLGPTLPMKRGGDAVEVARAILWLLSDDASYSTGTFIDVSGGR